MRVRIPHLPLGPDGEMDHHTSLRTRRSRFESWSGYCDGGYVVTAAWQIVSLRVRVRVPLATLERDSASPRSVADGTRLCEGRRPGSTPGGDSKCDAGARRQGNRLQPGRSGFDSHRRLSFHQDRFWAIFWRTNSSSNPRVSAISAADIFRAAIFEMARCRSFSMPLSMPFSIPSSTAS